MPLTRYQIRNEYASSDPEVYLQADKDDPEALLEAVSMAGLVGILRQLGDLSEFAADIFHDLHEEVLATASRGHGLMVRVQQLETEFPLIEKALLSRMNHSSFFYGARVDWHPSMRSQENLIAQGELPRFIMDSYEECRGPPRLFFLDKFDVAGAGACLKRYTDPALFKEGTALEDTHREKKVRRVKKKGMRGKNGETPEFMQMPHAKLHQLFLQERVEISNSNPSQIVKLKRRQFNESSFCSKNGKSYMDKFVDSSYPDSKAVFVDPAACPALQWASDGNVPEAIDIHSVSPTEIGSRLMDTSTSIRQTLSEKSSFENLDEMVTNEKKMVKSAPPPDEVAYEIFNVQDVQEMQLAEMTGRIENGVDGFRSDEITSEVENYVDAAATLESEVDAESDLEAKTSKRFYNARKHETDSITTDDQVEHQFQFSDSQSWDYSVSDDGNTFVRKGSSTFSYSDGQSILNENILSDSEGVVGRAFPSGEAGTSKYVLDTTKENMLQKSSDKLMMPTSLKEEAIYTNPLSTDRNDNLFPNDFRGNYDHAFSSDVPSENREECLSRLTSENQMTNVEEVEESTVSSDLLQHRSSSWDLPYVAESDASHRRKAFNSDEDGELISAEKCKSGLSFAEMSQKHPPHTSRLPEITDSSGFTLFCYGSPVYIAIDVDVDRPCSTVVTLDAPPVAEPNTEHCPAMEDILHIESKQQDHSLSVDAPINEQNVSIDHCRDDERKLDENLRASTAVGDLILAWEKQIDVKAISCDSCSTSSDDHLASLDDLDMEPSAKITSDGILSACNENIACTDSTAVDALSILYPELVGPGPAISYETEIQPIDTTGSYDVTNEEEVSQAEQCSSQSDLKSQVDFKFEKDERPSSLPEESLVISDSQDNWLPNKESEDKPACESDLLSSSESNLSPLDYQEVEHGVRLERPPEFQADAPSAKFQNKDETSSESICHPPEQMKSFNLMCHEDIFSKPGTTEESSVELENHKLGEFLKDSKVISILPGLQSDIVQPQPTTCECDLSSSSESNLSPLDYQEVEHGVRLERPPEFQADAPSAKFQNKDETSSESICHPPEQMKSFNLMCHEDIFSKPGTTEESSVELENHKLGEFLKDSKVISILPGLQSDIVQPQPTCECDLSSSSESNLSPLDYQEVEHGVRLERPPEFQADAPSAKFQNKDETSSESICHPPEQMKSFNLMCHEDIFSKPGTTEESSVELENHKLGEFLKDSKVISILPGPQSDIVQPSDGTIEDKGSDTSKSYADDQWSQFHCSKPSEQTVLPLVRQNKPDQALFSVASAGVYREYVPPTFLEDPPVHSIEDGGCLKSSSPTAVGQSPAPDYMSWASPVSLQTQVRNSITVPHEDFAEKGLEQVPNPETLQHIDNPAKNILPYLEKEKVQSTLLPAERLIACTSGQPATSTCPGELPATSSESSSVFEGAEWPLVCRTSEAENESLTGGSAYSEMMQDERQGHGPPCLEGEAASVPPEESEVAEPVTSNIARPPKRLIEAVAAHDRSMLRKVTERIRPPVQPAVSGDSFLEQIRTKSFNLKPAVATRPSIQCPKTNLKVAAILEKANSIRQACAGSDEDDDDSWSDS